MRVYELLPCDTGYELKVGRYYHSYFPTLSPIAREGFLVSTFYFFPDGKDAKDDGVVVLAETE